MNEQLQNTINAALQKAIEAATQGAEFLKGEIPDVIQQLLMWKLCSNLLVVALFPLFLWVAYKSVFVWSSQERDRDGFWSPSKAVSALIFGLCTGAWSVMSISSAFEALKIWLAPKVWLLEYAASLIK